jgi:hypothetical protein
MNDLMIIYGSEAITPLNTTRKLIKYFPQQDHCFFHFKTE